MWLGVYAAFCFGFVLGIVATLQFVSGLRGRTFTISFREGEPETNLSIDDWVGEDKKHGGPQGAG